MENKSSESFRDKVIWFFVKALFFTIIIVVIWIFTKDIDEGIVYHKEFRRANKGTVKETVRKPRSKGRAPLETTKTKIVSFPDRWVLYIHSESKEDSTVFFVQKNTYDSIQIGDKFVFSSDKATRKEPYIGQR